jgi:hypothetical protein
MDNPESKPSLASGMAKRSFWLALIGGVLGFVCRIEALGNAVQGSLCLVAIALLLIASVFGLVALIRITRADRDSVLVPGLAGLLLAICFTVSLARWSRSDWARARSRALQLQAASTSAQPQATEGQAPLAAMPPRNAVNPKPASVVHYELPALDKIPAVTLKIKSDATQQTGEDAAVLRAWAAHLERIQATYTNTSVALSRLQAARLLEPGWIVDFSDAEAVRRRGLANQFADAWHQLDNALSTLHGSYCDDLRKEQVTPDRTSVEAQAIMAFVQQREVADRIALLRKFCQAEEKVGRGYNDACSKVFDDARIAHQAPDAASAFRKQMEDELLKLRETEQAAAQARQDALAVLEAKP